MLSQLQARVKELQAGAAVCLNDPVNNPNASEFPAADPKNFDGVWSVWEEGDTRLKTDDDIDIAVADGGVPRLPDWYLAHRTHAHTRLAVNEYCKNTSSGWTCEDIFENAGKKFASIGVPAYVRHSHTGDESMMWPSRTAPRAGWHPLVVSTQQSSSCL